MQDKGVRATARENFKINDDVINSKRGKIKYALNPGGGLLLKVR
jgi:hypothetical protein